MQLVIKMTYAIVADGGRQLKIEPGQKVDIDYREAEAGSTVTFDRVLAISDDNGFRLGTPTIDGASVTAKVIGDTKGEKVYIQKFRRRKNSKRRTGHRQKYVTIQIDAIS